MKQRTRRRLAAKLHPRRLRVSGKFHAILACLLGRTWTSPALVGLFATADGFLLGQAEGAAGANEFLGSQADLARNLAGVARAAGLSPRERRALFALAAARTGRPRAA